VLAQTWGGAHKVDDALALARGLALQQPVILAGESCRVVEKELLVQALLLLLDVDVDGAVVARG